MEEREIGRTPKIFKKSTNSNSVGRDSSRKSSDGKRSFSTNIPNDIKLTYKIGGKVFSVYFETFGDLLLFAKFNRNNSVTELKKYT
jgi:hypothetical protein